MKAFLPGVMPPPPPVPLVVLVPFPVLFGYINILSPPTHMMILINIPNVIDILLTEIGVLKPWFTTCNTSRQYFLES